MKVAIKNWQSNLRKAYCNLGSVNSLEQPVHDAPVARDDVAKVLDLERSFESRCKEAAEGSDDGGEKGEEEGVEEEGEEGDRLLHVKQPPPCGQCLTRFEGFQDENISTDEVTTCGRVYSCCRKRADGSQDIVILSSSPDNSYHARHHHNHNHYPWADQS